MAHDVEVVARAADERVGGRAAAVVDRVGAVAAGQDVVVRVAGQGVRGVCGAPDILDVDELVAAGVAGLDGLRGEAEVDRHAIGARRIIGNVVATGTGCTAIEGIRARAAAQRIVAAGAADQPVGVRVALEDVTADARAADVLDALDRIALGVPA